MKMKNEKTEKSTKKSNQNQILFVAPSFSLWQTSATMRTSFLLLSVTFLLFQLQGIQGIQGIPSVTQCPTRNLRLMTRLWTMARTATITTQDVSDEFEEGFAPVVTELNGFRVYQGSVVNTSRNYFQNVFQGVDNSMEAQLSAVVFVEGSLELNGQIEPVRFQQGDLQFYFTENTKCYGQNEADAFFATQRYVLKESATFSTQQVSDSFQDSFSSIITANIGFLTYGSMIPDPPVFSAQRHNFFFMIFETEEQAATANAQALHFVKNSDLASQIDLVEEFTASITFDINGASVLIVTINRGDEVARSEAAN